MVAPKRVEIEFGIKETVSAGADKIAGKVERIGTASVEAQRKLDALEATSRRASSDPFRKASDSGFASRGAGYQPGPKGGMFDPTVIDELASKNIAAQRKAAAVKARMDELSPPESKVPPGGGIPAQLKAALGAQAFAQAMQSVGAQMKSQEDQVISYGQALDSLTLGFVAGIPIIGGFVKGITDLIEATTGVGAERAGNTKSLALTTGRVAAQTAIQGAQVNAAGQLAGVNRQAGNAALEAAAARQFQQSLTPQALASFRPRARFGQATEQTGEVRFQAAQAEAEAAAARQQAEAERRRFGQAEAKLDLPNLRGRSAMYQKDVDEAGRRRDQADIALQGKGSAVGAFFAGGLAPGGQGGAGPTVDRNAALDITADKARTDELEKQQRLKGALTQQDNALKSLAEQRKALADAETNSAQKQLALAQANLAVSKDRLAIVTQQVEAGRAGAQSIGAMRPGETRRLERAIDKANDPSGRRLNERDRSLIGGYGPGGQDLLQRRDEAAGRANPAFERIQQKLGQPGLPALEQQQANFQDEVRKSTANAQTDFKNALAGSAEAFVTDMAKIIQETLTVAIAKLKTELSSTENKAARDLAGQPQR